MQKTAAEALRRVQNSDGFIDAEISADAKAKANLIAAEREYNAFVKRLPDIVTEGCKAIRGELAADLDKSLAVDPDALDSNTMELMKAGVLTPTDYQRLSEKAGNATMLRVIGSFAEKALAEIPVDDVMRSADRAILRSVAESGKGATPEAFLSNFDALTAMAGTVARNPLILSQWGELSSGVVEAF